MAKSSFHGSFSFILAAKLKALKGILKAWNKEVFSRVESKKLEALRRVSYWDNLEKERELGLEKHEERTKAKDDFKSWALMEEISWRQIQKNLAERRRQKHQVLSQDGKCSQEKKFSPKFEY